MNVHPLDSSNTKKRHRSPDDTTRPEKRRQRQDDPFEHDDAETTTESIDARFTITHQDEDGNLLERLSKILVEIKTTPSTGEISADLLGQLRQLMLRIEELAADESNSEARQLKDESDKYLEMWFEDLVAQCDADGEIDWESMAYDQLGGSDRDNNDDDADDDDDDDDMIALAMALQDEEEAINDEDVDGTIRLDAVTMETALGDEPSGELDRMALVDRARTHDDLSIVSAPTSGTDASIVTAVATKAIG
ncbi:hypothetical protein [Absidia glauca]|uniref:Uncharacterized protein n=1 Tax=Absidia glauca TaxID=4829 RepID=A0A163K7F9_ABSGL|nr:hypothetical protein [Absidia glauca]